MTLTTITHGLTLCRHVAAPTGAGSLYTIGPALHLEIVSSIHTVIARHPLGHDSVTLSGAVSSEAGKMSIGASSNIISNHSPSFPLLLVIFDEANVRGGPTEKRPGGPDAVQRVTTALLLHVFQSRLECADHPKLWK